MVDSGNTYRDKVSRLVGWGHWFSFFNIIIAMLLGTRYIASSGWPETLLGQTYQIFTWIGHFGFLVFAVYILIIFPASFLIPYERLMRLFAVFVATFGLTALLLDIYAYEVLHLHLNPLVWQLLLSGEKTDTNAAWQYLFIAVPIIFLIELLISEWVWKKLRILSRKRVGTPITLVFVFCFIASHLIHIWADAFLYSPVTSQRSDLPLSYPMTAKSFMEKYGLFDPQEYQKKRDELGNAQNNQMRYPIHPLAFSTSAFTTKPNLLMIMMDSVRADVINPIVTPNLDAYAKKNIQFLQHHSSGNDEMPGLFGLFYGLPAKHAQTARIEGIYPLMIETLKKQRYQFGLFSSNNFKNPIYFRNIFGKHLKQAFLTTQSAPWLADKEAINALENWVVKTKAPWFSYLELTSVANFETIGQYAEIFQPSLREKPESVTQSTSLLLKNSYYNAAHYLDGLLGKLLENLTNKGLLKNTVVVITSNHGLEFNDTQTNSWGSNTNYSRYQLQVPLIIHWPNQIQQSIDTPSSHLDIVPTLMENLLGVTSSNQDYSSGLNLFDLKDIPREWLLAGDSKDIVIVQADKTVVVDKFGNYRVFDTNYKLQPNAKPQLSTLMQAMAELERFRHRRNQPTE